ncbi:MAG TPA: hypothetical protein VFQ26_00545 [Nitrospiraceae bacterium]|nr:hypothetical protein [Nitrospiraceae bacterium]
MGRTYAGILGPLAFTTILARGVFNGSGAESTLILATTCLFAFAGVGYVVGQIADSIVLEAVKFQFNAELQAREGTPDPSKRSK